MRKPKPLQAVLLCLALRARSAVLRHHLPEQPGSPADLAPFRVIRRAGLRADAHGCPEPSKFSQLPARGAAPAQQSGRGTRRGAGPRSCGHTQAGKAEKEKRSGGGSAERGGAARDLLNRDLPVGIFGCHRFICWAALGNSRHAADPSGRGQPAEPSRAPRKAPRAPGLAHEAQRGRTKRPPEARGADPAVPERRRRTAVPPPRPDPPQGRPEAGTARPPPPPPGSPLPGRGGSAVPRKGPPPPAPSPPSPPPALLAAPEGRAEEPPPLRSPPPVGPGRSAARQAGRAAQGPAAAGPGAQPLPMRMRICFLPKRREKSEEMVRPMAAAEEEGRERRGAGVHSRTALRRRQRADRGGARRHPLIKAQAAAAAAV